MEQTGTERREQEQEDAGVRRRTLAQLPGKQRQPPHQWTWQSQTSGPGVMTVREAARKHAGSVISLSRRLAPPLL